MPRRFVTLILLAIFFVLLTTRSTLVSADTHNNDQVLSQHPQWLALLHMQKNPLTGNYRSEVDDNSFFLSGKNDDSAAELRATISALQQAHSNDRSAWCRFPARAAFLARHLALQKPNDLQCTALADWRMQFSPEEITLVYPDPYLKKIASIFGHTFLRIDAKDKIEKPVLLSQTISYYADVGATDNSAVLYVAKGLTGRFPGVIALDPYFERLRTYSDNEDRDIREYTLALTQDKVREFIDHVWEVKGSSFNYFFLDENCSYRLISLLDVVTPTHNLREQFTTHTIPIDTIKALQANHLISKTRYIPSARKRFYASLENLTPEQNQQLKELLQGKMSIEQVVDEPVLEATRKYRSIQIQTDPNKKTLHAQQAHQAIQQQFKINTVTQGKSPPLTAPDPTTTGHDIMRVQTGWQHDDGKDYLTLGTRYAFHDFHDPLIAYQKGVQLEVLNFQVRIDPSNDASINLDNIRWFDLQSYSPSDDFFQEASWGISVVRQRELLGNKVRLANMIEGYRGIAKHCGPLLCHAEIIGGALTNGSLNKDWDLRAGVRVGALYQTTNWSWSADASQQQYLINSSDALTRFNTEASYRITKDLSAYFSYSHEENDDATRDRFQLSLRTFF